MAALPEVERFVAALEKTQYLSPDRLQAYQRRLLDVLLRHAREQATFYADRLAPLFRADDSIDWDRWHEIPILTRSEAQENSALLTARALPPEAGASVANHSSGSTGRPFRYLNTQIQNLGSGCANERFFHWHQIDPTALTAIIWAMDDPETAAYPLGRPPHPWRMGHPESEATDLVISTPVAEQVEWLRRTGATYFASYPTNMREVGRIAAEDGVPFQFSAVLTNGEMTTEETSGNIREYFGHQPVDRYGSAEVGLIAMSCPHSLRHHVAAELVLIEVIRDDGTPAAPGIEGRIVATPLYALAMPLIRYDMGDLSAFAAEPCGCGRTLPLLERIYGRSRNMFRFPDGRSVWPVLESRRVQEFLHHRQFQVVQVSGYNIEYRYVPADPALPVDHAGLTDYARQKLHPAVTITPVAVDAIKRPSGGKLEDYISLVG